MDIWGTGCVLFEVLSLFPLFPGNNELDQIHKIHNILGTPPQQILDNFQKHATHMDFDFPPKEGTGISQLIPHVAPECQELIAKLLAYTPDDRLTAKQALNHPCFKEFRTQEQKSISAIPGMIIEDGSDDEQKLAKRQAKGEAATVIEYQRTQRKIQQGSNKWIGKEYAQDKHNSLIETDEPVLPMNV